MKSKGATKETWELNKKSVEEFKHALNTACGEINEAARLAGDVFEGESLKAVRRELARLMEIVDAKILIHLEPAQKS
jgi:hypothetical protein